MSIWSPGGQHTYFQINVRINLLIPNDIRTQLKRIVLQHHQMLHILLWLRVYECACSLSLPRSHARVYFRMPCNEICTIVIHWVQHNKEKMKIILVKSLKQM